MLLFEFVRLLFRFAYQTPALDELFQLPLDRKAMLRRLPLLLLPVIEYDPCAHHAAKLVNQFTYR